MKNEIIFESDRYFTLYDIVVSHGQLLLRSQKNNYQKNNIDIIFFDTTYIQSFSRLKGLKITIAQKGKEIVGYDTVNKYLSYENNNLFVIKSNNEEYYIAASFVRIFENDLEFSESSLHTINKGEEIVSSI